ncbi:MAG: hypothetical protein HRT68_13585, partial [Flavobacteriaceae bacterium]|nr:hypothetical protein [Flavobacteriaceae bacterium]
MKRFLLYCFMLLAGSAIAQAPQGFNYQTVVRDSGGNILANTNIGIQFRIHQIIATGTVVYTETHSLITNDYGLTSTVIGTGTSTDNFTTINWSNNTYFLEVAIDLTGGTSYMSMGTTQLLSVPYALNAAEANNVTGLEALDEGNGIGWRLIGRGPVLFANIGLNATDLSASITGGDYMGASGESSFTSGFQTIASGYASTALGGHTHAYGNYSTG